MKKLAYFAPVGRDLKADFRFYFIGLAIAVLFSLSFFVSLASAYREMINGEWPWMELFVFVLGVSLWCFPVLAVGCLCYIFFYYQMHFGSAKTTYLMKRLPDRWSLHRRCLTLPIMMAMITLLIGAALFWIYYGIYQVVTPPEALKPDQLDFLLGNWFRGEVQWQNGVAVQWR